MKTIITLLAITLLVLVAVANTAVAAPQPNAADTAKPAVILPPGHVPITAAPAAIQLTRKGKVLDVVDSPPYTYLQVTGDKYPVWLAAYKTDISKGSIVNYSDGVAMSNFHSKSLSRTFDTIIFVDRVEPEKK